MTKNKPVIIAHRGASFDAPENTLAAIKLAWEQDADAVEVDVQLSRDNKIVVIHDFNTKRVGNKNSLVKTQTLSELRKLDVGSWKDSKWSGEKIPRLNEVLSTVPGDKKLIVEIKCGTEIISELVSTVKKMEIGTDRIEFISFDLSVCIAVKNVLPEYKVLLLSEMDYTWLQRIFRPSIDRLINVALKHNLDGLDLWSGNLIDENLILICVTNNLLLYTWTINSPEKAKELISLGVDGITTDLPGQFKELVSDLY